MAIKISGVTVIDNDSNIINVQSASFTGSGFIKIPTGNTSQRPSSPSEGMIRYNSELQIFEGYQSGEWAEIAGGGGATGGGDDEIFYENGATIASSYTISSSNNAGTFGPISIAPGVIVTIPTGSRWTIV